jgi:hypothetical protein
MTAALRRHYVKTAVAAGLVALACVVAGLTTVAAGWLLNWALAGWCVLAASTRSFDLTERFHRLRPWEQWGRVYDRLGLRLYARLPLVRSSPRLVLRARHELQTFAGACRAAEAAHVVAFGVVALCSSVLSLYDRNIAWWTMTSNLVTNLPAVLLQRRNRGRVARLLGMTRVDENWRRGQLNRYAG